MYFVGMFLFEIDVILNLKVNYFIGMFVSDCECFGKY